MHFHAVLNRDGGTFSDMDLDAFAERLNDTLGRAGHSAEVATVRGGEIEEALRAACDSDADVVVAGGGDGTVSLAAGLVADRGKILGILPAGTMNLFARSLGIPPHPEAALETLVEARERRVDIARADGRPFVHQLSIGMHPQLIRQRERIPFRGRLGKMLASTRAGLLAIMRPQNLRVALSLQEGELTTVTSGISVTNNLYGEGHLPFADRPDGGVLGIYVTRARSPRDLAMHFLNMALGRWRRNEQVEIHQAGEVRLRILSPRKRLHCSIDGELCPLATEVHIRLEPGMLRVLVPRVQ